MSSKDMNVGELLKTANRLKREGQLEEAIALYHQVIEINPNFSWAYHNLGDAFVKQEKLDEAIVEYRKAIEINPNSAWLFYCLAEALIQQKDLEAAIESLRKAIHIRPKCQKLYQIVAHIFTQKYELFEQRYLSLIQDQNTYIKEKIEKPNKKQGLFIDCGGYDGCSVLKFLMNHFNYDCITFEPNPDLWNYYQEIPTKLIKKAVFTHDGSIEFIVDPVDADGSSLLKDKKIDYYGEVSNQDCPVLTVDCIDLSSFIVEVSQLYSEIILKLDVEGAEYDVLEKMLQDRTVCYIDKLFCEFHWHKVNIPKERHDRLISKLQKLVIIENWDAQDLSIHRKDVTYTKIRSNILESIKLNRKLDKSISPT